MSIRSIIAGNGIGINNRQRDIPNAIVQQPLTYSQVYTRPSDWPALSTIGPTDQKFIGLYAVSNIGNDSSAGSYAIVSAVTSSGTYSVNWGDGTTTSGITSGTTSQHQYNYSTLGTSVTSRGYKTATITITPDTGNLTQINLNNNFSGVTNLPNFQNWLDISVGSPYLTQIYFTTNNGSNTSAMPLLEQVQIISTASNFNTAYLFYGLSVLQSIPTLNLSNILLLSVSNMFGGCSKLKVAPAINVSSVTGGGINANSMFSGCFELIYIPNYTFTINNTPSMFYQCYSLIVAPTLIYNISGTGGMQTMFFSCYNLQYVPPMQNSALTTNSMFLNCYNLKNAPLINTSTSTDMGSMFQNCYSLTSVSSYNTSNVANIVNTFANCNSLSIINSTFTNTSITSTANTFSGCINLSTAPSINTINVTNTFGMFNNCLSLNNVPNYNFSNVTNMSNTFLGCANLTSIPSFNTVNVANMSYTFANCTTLPTIPSLNFSNVTNCFATFANCISLSSVPNLTTTNVTNMGNMFYSTALQTAPNLSTTANVTNMPYMFNNTSLSTGPTFDSTANVTNMTGMFNNIITLSTVPTYNTAGAITFNPFNANLPMLSSVGMTNIRTTFSLPSTNQLGNVQLQNIFANLSGNSTSKTITITGSLGADTPQSQTGNVLLGGQNFYTANTVGLNVGMVVSAPTQVTTFGAKFSNTSPVINLVGGGGNAFASGSGNPAVSFTSIPTGVGGLSPYIPYYVVSANSTSGWFQISATPGGNAITFSGSNSTTTVNILTLPTITYIVANSYIVLSSGANSSANGVTLTARYLDTSQALLKNWTVTG
jgi:surface protein